MYTHCTLSWTSAESLGAEERKNNKRKIFDHESQRVMSYSRQSLHTIE